MKLDLFYRWADQVPVESFPQGQEPAHFLLRPEGSGDFLVKYRLRWDVHNWLVEKGEQDYTWGFTGGDLGNKGLTMWIEFQNVDNATLFKLTWGGQ